MVVRVQSISTATTLQSTFHNFEEIFLIMPIIQDKKFHLRNNNLLSSPDRMRLFLNQACGI